MYFLCSMIYVPYLSSLYFLNFTDPEANEEITTLLTVNAKNLMTAVSEVIKATEGALIKVPPEACVDVIHLN